MCEAMQQKEKRFMAIGKAEGRLEALVSLWKKNRLILPEAANEAGMTVEEFVEKTALKGLVNEKDGVSRPGGHWALSKNCM